MENLAPGPRDATSLAAHVRALAARVRGAAIWRVVALTQPRFLVGVCALLRTNDGRILLLENRFWQGERWGCPSGYMRRGETAQRTAIRECREECGVTARDVQIARVVTGFPQRLEVWCTGRIDIDAAPGPRALQSREITGAALLEPTEALALMRASQAAVVRELLAA